MWSLPQIELLLNERGNLIAALPKVVVRETSLIAVSSVTPTIIISMLVPILRAQYEIELVVECEQGTGIRDYTFSFFRDTVELVVNDRYVHTISGNDLQIISLRFIDPAPTAGSHVYDVRALSNGTNSTVNANRLGTASGFGGAAP